ncbi:Flavodoxin/nitric oxide synthase [Artemisia annua]|uniref:Flavodoxin/nitric oxide synthase n=1 Tax=Artemisia annua TaxID=35608 RepID=A0A2U1LRV5_ARTAN|nr:Flavodoxin/nitric oxide synthase [Artemisia annua]
MSKWCYAWSSNTWFSALAGWKMIALWSHDIWSFDAAKIWLYSRWCNLWNSDSWFSRWCFSRGRFSRCFFAIAGWKIVFLVIHVHSWRSFYWTTITQLAHHRMLFVSVGYTFGAGMFKMDSSRGGTPYGAGVFAGDGTCEPTEAELALAEHQGKYWNGVEFFTYRQ